MINIEVAGSKVSGVSDSLPLAITTENGWTITFESDINVSRSIDDSGLLGGEDPETTSTLAESLIGLTIRSVETNNGILQLEFDGSLEISVAPDPDFESWNIVGPGKERVVCLAGGEMAYWSANLCSTVIPPRHAPGQSPHREQRCSTDPQRPDTAPLGEQHPKAAALKQDTTRLTL